MIRDSIEHATHCTGGRLWLPQGRSASAEFAGMTHDSRLLRPGMLYAAIVGSRVDGHDFLDDAASRGAAAALVSRRIEAAPLAQIEVVDVVRAMGDLARAWRVSLPVRLVAVTGSNGKTTVKTMLAAILARRAPTLATRGNYNNEIGVPLTLAALGEKHRYAVVEMGCSQSGDIAYLAGIGQPDVAVVTNAGPAHLERLGDIEGVARTKGELFSALGPDGVAVINLDDRYADYWRSLCPGRRQIGFGRGPEARVRLELRGSEEWVVTPEGEFQLVLTLPGAHNRMNALAATAAAMALGLAPAEIAAALASVESIPGRLYERRMAAGWTLIDDSYNANPASLYAALNVLAERPGRRWLVLGNMAELGTESTKLHREIGIAARDLGVDRLFAFGEHAAAAADAFGEGSEMFGALEPLLQRLEAGLEAGVTCLVKGSRSAGMDRVVARLDREEVASC